MNPRVLHQFQLTNISTSMFEWYGVGCGSKDKHPKDTCLEEIGLHDQNMLIILDSRLSMWLRGTTTWWARDFFTLRMNKIFIQTPTLISKWSWVRFRFLNHLALMCVLKPMRSGCEERERKEIKSPNKTHHPQSTQDSCPYSCKGVQYKSNSYRLMVDLSQLAITRLIQDSNTMGPNMLRTTL